MLVGRATRLAQFLSGAEKEYDAVIRLGYATDTGDVTGQPVTTFNTEAQRNTEIHREEIETAMAALRGETEQLPPMYSAKKVAGRPAFVIFGKDKAQPPMYDISTLGAFLSDFAVWAVRISE